MIYYSHVNEDNCVERSALEQAGSTDCICIAGSGERVIALLDAPKLLRMQVVDHNVSALYLIQLKLAALQYLTVAEYLAFVGFRSANDQQRASWYTLLAPHLSADCRAFWDTRLTLIQAGVAFAGHFEQFLSRIRPVVNTWLGPGILHALSGDYTKFPYRAWRLLKLSFSQRWVYRLFGNRDDAFVSDRTHVRLIPDGIQQLIDERRLGESFMAHLIFQGNLQRLPSAHLPPSLHEDRLNRIQLRLRSGALAISYQHVDLADLLEKTDFAGSGRNLFISLSDIVSFAPNQYFFDCLKTIGRRHRGNLTVVFRAFLKNRLEVEDIERLGQLGYRCQERSEEDLTRMYQIYTIDRP